MESFHGISDQLSIHGKPCFLNVTDYEVVIAFFSAMSSMFLR